ncbi:hypothetical protein T01_5951 [Trichinella spiralis]|uniref:Uncharacterized protein n=1 Tax=Trichinella spiralis TaxID=6334 RepID=A0A0V1B8Y8_TRISP|nr:hypothetical protein T01_5951 [Trichinella spiralis]
MDLLLYYHRDPPLYAYAYSGAHMRKQYLHLLAVLVVTAETQALVSSVSFLQLLFQDGSSFFQLQQ